MARTSCSGRLLLEVMWIAWSSSLNYNLPPDGFWAAAPAPFRFCTLRRCGLEVLPRMWINSEKNLTEPMNQREKHFYVFGSFRFDCDERLLWRGSEKVPLSPKLAGTLSVLLRNAGHLVTKEELIAQVWPDTFVEDGNLNKNMSVLRKTLWHWEGDREYIETVPKRGYRFIETVDHRVEEEAGPVPVLTATQQPGTPRSLHGLRRRVLTGLFVVFLFGGLAGWQLLWRRPSHNRDFAVRSLAVLPLENLSGDPSQDYFAESMTDELITNLGQIGALRVISRTSAMQYRASSQKGLPEIARELNVDAIVEGSVVKLGEQVRITAQLIQARSDKHLWAHSYEGNARDILTLQRQIAGAIAEQIRIQLTPQQQAVLNTEHVVNPDSYEDYLRGHYVVQTGAIDAYERSIVYLKQAIAKDPANAAAYAGLAESYIELGHMVRLPPEQAFPPARKAALRAIEIDESLSEAHLALANVKFLYDWDFPSAEQEFRRALELNPNSVNARADYADYLMAMGRTDESIVERKRNLDIDPLARRPIWALATGYYWARRYDEAIALARRAIELDPNHWSGHLDLGLALEQKHQFDEAVSELRKAVAASNNKLWVSFVAHDLALSGNRASAENMIAELQRLSQRTYVSPWLLAMIYPDLGDKDKAFKWLEKCYERREHDLVFSNVWPMFAILRTDPRYQDLIRRVGLPQRSSE
jgi:TolB-like protein/DNA-binding winged helix-turn-helix (wHTH) protein/Flp pilus assembly protein TadD